MFFTICWSVFVHIVQRASCAVPLRIVTIKANGALTPSQPPVINIIPDQDPLIQGRRHQTPHPPPALRNSYDDSIYDSSETEEFPNQYNYTGYYYDKDYYKYFQSAYINDGDVGFQFKHPRYPYEHTLFAPALFMKQVPHVFRDVFFPTQQKERLSSIMVGDFYTQTVPFELFPAQKPGKWRRAGLNPKSSKLKTSLKPQTQHRILRTRPKDNVKSKNFQSVLSYYAYNDQKDESKLKRSVDKKLNNKNFQSMLSYYEDENGSKYSSSKKKGPRPSHEKRLQLNRRLERIRAESTSWDVAVQKPRPPEVDSSPPPLTETVDPYNDIYNIVAEPQKGPPGLLTIPDPQPLTRSTPVNARRQGDPIMADSHEGKLPLDSPYELYMPGAAAMAVGPVISFFKNLFKR